MKFLTRWLPLLRFKDSASYWDKRYRLGGDSGEGSYGEFAGYKSRVLNQFVAQHTIKSVVEFGCGDGHQLSLATYPRYLGVDISSRAIDRCKSRFAGDLSKTFVVLSQYVGQRAELALSLDVLFHLVEDEVYDDYLDRLFSSALRYVVVFSTSVPGGVTSLRHVRHRNVESDLNERFPLFRRMVDQEANLPPPVPVKSGPQTRFFLYERIP